MALELRRREKPVEEVESAAAEAPVQEETGNEVLQVSYIKRTDCGKLSCCTWEF